VNERVIAGLLRLTARAAVDCPEGLALICDGFADNMEAQIRREDDARKLEAKQAKVYREAERERLAAAGKRGRK
jgi:hypothetical protein